MHIADEIGALDVSKMKEMFDTNIFGLVDLTNKVVPQMKARTRATSSTSRRRPG
jgi:NADP-dependent 3-hydroxy acid dehydrogenase YdfG